MEVRQASLVTELHRSREREEEARSENRLNQMCLDARRRASSARDPSSRHLLAVRCRLDDVGYDRAIAGLQMGLYERALEAFHEKLSIGDALASPVPGAWVGWAED